MNTPDPSRILPAFHPGRSGSHRPLTGSRHHRAAPARRIQPVCRAVLTAVLPAGGATAHAQETRATDAAADASSRLDDLGLTPSLVFANLTTYNATVGSRKRKWGNSGNLFVGLDADLGKSLGWHGTELHFLHTFFPFLHGTGQPASEEWPGSAGAYHAGAMLHNDLASGYLSPLTLSQKLLDDRLYLEIGRMNARQIFMVSNCETMISCTDPLLDTATGTLP